MKLGTSSSKHAIQISAIYLAVSACWIFFSDRLLGSVVSESQLLMQMQTYKGWFFVLVTSILLFYLIRRSTSSIIEGTDKTEEALREKQQLLSELHHRVKNNLAIICGLIDLQVSSLNRNEAKALVDIQYRIYTLAEIEELLYQNKDMSRIPFHEYVSQFIEKVKEEVPNTFSIQEQIDELYISIDQAIPLGLLLNEILTQLRLTDANEQDQAVEICLACPSPKDVLMKLQFNSVSASVFRPLREEGHIEHTLMGLYVQQLDSSTRWLQKNGSIIYKLDFKKSAKQQANSLI